MSSKRKLEDQSRANTKKNKRPNDGENCGDINDSGKLTSTSAKTGFFNGLCFYILKAGIEKARFNIFQNQIIQNDGGIEESISSINDNKVSHVLVDDKMEVDRMLRLFGMNRFPKAIVVKTMWLSMCLKKKELVNSEEYELKSDIPHQNTESDDEYKVCDVDREPKQVLLHECESLMVPQKGSVNSSNNEKTLTSYEGHLKCNHNTSEDSDYEASDDELKSEGMDLTSGVSKKNFQVDKWICAQSSKNPQPNHNKHITDKLEEMVKAYNSTNDKWRSYGYQKCIRALMRHPKKISSWEEAKALPGVGGRLADKIWEIAQSGELRKLNEFKSSEEIKTLELFNNVWGAGPHTSQMWYQQGFRTIEDLRVKAKLTSQQKVGVRLYEDILERMPREEAGQIANVVKEAAESIQPGIIAQACGSYRRGKPTCGDVDILVTHPDGRSQKGVFGKLLDKLHECGFLTDDLVSAEENGNQKKYLGVCKLPGENSKHRRLDIIVVPYHEYACALMYFTGSAHFNRSLRLLCKRQDMSLSEHALRCGVVRQGGERVHEGSIIPTPTEESVFKVLKIPYRPPEERDH